MDQVTIIIQLLEKLDGKTDRIETRLDAIEKQDAVQNEQLATHMRRSDALENSLSLLRKEFKPVQRHVDVVNSLAKISVAVLGISGTIFAVVKILSQILK